MNENHILDNRLYEKFTIGDLFELTGVKQAKSQKLIPTKEDGIPYIVQSQSNNMISRKVDKQYLLNNDEPVCEGNVIVLGVTLPTVSYQPVEFGASQVITAYNKNLNEEVGLYLVALLKQQMYRFSYSNKPGMSKYKELILKLPIQTDTNSDPILDPNNTYHPDGYIPDWNFMQKYIEELEKERIEELEKERIEELEKYLLATGLNDYQLTDEDIDVLSLSGFGYQEEPNRENVAKIFEEFKVSDLFDVEKWTYGKNKNWLSKYDEYQAGRTPVISGITKNNGIIYYTEDDYDATEIQQPYLTITTRGEYSGTVFYHDEPFLLLNNVLTLPISNVTKNQQLFLASLIMKLGYGGYNNYPTKEKLAANYIPLPIQTDEDNNPVIDPARKHHPDGYIPDWNFMEKYIRAIEKVVIADVVKYKDEVIAKTKETVG